MLNKILIFFSVLFFFPSYLWYFKIEIFLGAGRPNDFSAPWFIGYQISIHRHMPLFSCCWWPPTSGKEMTKCYLAIQQRMCCMQFKWKKKKKKKRLHSDSREMESKCHASWTLPKSNHKIGGKIRKIHILITYTRDDRTISWLGTISLTCKGYDTHLPPGVFMWG
jgi:hypothetical protein